MSKRKPRRPVPSPRTPKAPKRKRETARDLRAKLETLQIKYDALERREKTRDEHIAGLAELLRPHIEEIAMECAHYVVGDHETFEHNK